MKKAFVILLATWVWLFACAVPAAAEEASKHPEPLAWYTFDDPENLGPTPLATTIICSPREALPTGKKGCTAAACIWMENSSHGS